MAQKLLLFFLLAVASFPTFAQVLPLKEKSEILQGIEKAKTDSAKALLLLDLSLSYVLKPGEFAGDLDTAILLVKQAEEINRRLQNKRIEAKACFVYANALREGGKSEPGKIYIEKSLAIYKTISEPSGMAEAWVELANYYSLYDSGINKKRECFQMALPLFQAVGNKEREADVLRTLGDIDQYQLNYVQAIKELRASLALYQSIGYKKLGGIYDLLGTVCANLGDYPGAVKYGLLAVKLAEEVQDTTMQMCVFYRRLGIAYAHWNKSEEAIHYAKKAMAIAIKYKDAYAMEIILLSLTSELSYRKEYEQARGFIRLTEAFQKNWKGPRQVLDTCCLDITYAFTYLLEKKYDSARPYVDQLVDLTKRYPRPGQLITRVYNIVFRYFMATRQYAEADKYASIALSFSAKVNDVSYMAKSHQMKSEVDSALGNLQSALFHARRYKKMTDSLLNVSTSFQFARMQVENEAEKKDANIVLLRQRDQLQRAQLMHTKLITKIVIGSVALLAILVILLYRRYLTKQRLSRNLESKQEEINYKNTQLEYVIKEKDALLIEKDGLLKEKEWLIQEIHHRVKNNLQMVINLLDTQAEFLTNPTAIHAIREGRERMQAIAIIHQKLYQMSEGTDVGMRAYAEELVHNIQNSVSDAARIDFHVDITDVYLDISQSVPLGLIMNEAITNALKYAYPQSEKGIVSISLKYSGIQELRLTIADQGAGMPTDIDTTNSNTLGLQLIRLFSEQLDGELDFINDNGLNIHLTFRIANVQPIGLETRLMPQ